MGDIRYKRPYEVIAKAADRLAALRRLSDDDVIAALAAASREHDPYLANVLATEAQNRVRNKTIVLESTAESMLSVDSSGMLTFRFPALRQGKISTVSLARGRS